jgi:septum site-determining protein MinD
MTRILSVVSGKGGVGKTTVAINISAVLHRFGRDVVLIDGNVTTPNVCLHLGISPTPTTLQDVLKGKISLKQAVYLHSSGLKIVPAGISIATIGSKFKKALDEVIVGLIGMTEFIIIDSAATLGKEARAAIEAGDEVIVVTNPELPAITDALKAVELARRSRAEKISTVVNRYSGAKYELGLKNIQEFLGVPIIGIIPEDIAVKRSIAMKRPVVFAFPKAPSTLRFKKLAAKLLGQEYELIEEKGLWQRIKQFFGF